MSEIKVGDAVEIKDISKIDKESSINDPIKPKKYYVFGRGGDRYGNGSKDVISWEEGSGGGYQATSGVPPNAPFWSNDNIDKFVKEEDDWFIIYPAGVLPRKYFWIHKDGLGKLDDQGGGGIKKKRRKSKREKSKRKKTKRKKTKRKKSKRKKMKRKK